MIRLEVHYFRFFKSSNLFVNSSKSISLSSGFPFEAGPVGLFDGTVGSSGKSKPSKSGGPPGGTLPLGAGVGFPSSCWKYPQSLSFPVDHLYIYIYIYYSNLEVDIKLLEICTRRIWGDVENGRKVGWKI